MYPDTRGRISTDSTASRRPVNSSHSFTSFSTAVTTFTGNGACGGADFFLHPPAVRKIIKIPTPTKKFFIAAGSQPRCSLSSRSLLNDNRVTSFRPTLPSQLKNSEPSNPKIQTINGLSMVNQTSIGLAPATFSSIHQTTSQTRGMTIVRG